MWILIIVVVAFLAWIAWGVVSVRSIKQPAYTVLEKTDGYEVREYPPYLIAQVTVEGSWSSALNSGFSILADYIFGNNTRQEAIAMTRPVGIEPGPLSESIAMTAPVLSEKKDDAFLVSFIMPSKYTSVTLPRPNNPEVRILEVPTSTMAVRTFSGWMNAEQAQREEDALRKLLVQDKRVILSAARVAQYNPPWTPPFLRRNEILIPIR